MRGREGLGQHAADGVGGSIDPQQRCERGGEIDGFGARAISSRLERQSVEGERHVRVVVVRRGVVCALAWADGVDIGNTHHVPTSFR